MYLEIFIKRILQNREQELARQGLYEKAASITEELNKIDPEGNHHLRADFYKREITVQRKTQRERCL